MRSTKSSSGKDEDLKGLTEKWKKRIVNEKGYSENAAMCIARKLRKLAEYMQYGYAIIAYYKRDGTFQLVTATLTSYSREFNQPYNIFQVHGAFVYWNVESGGWRTFQIENFLDWKPMI